MDWLATQDAEHCEGSPSKCAGSEYSMGKVRYAPIPKCGYLRKCPSAL